MIFRKSKSLHISEYPGHKELSLQVGPSDFLNPEYVYIPLVESGTPCECLVKAKDKVNVGQVVAMKNGRFGLPLHASISGEVTSVDKKMWHASAKMVSMIEIKNDFQETLDPSIKPNDVDKLSREDIVRIARECGIVGLGGSGFPTYAKYQTTTPIDSIIVNAVECEPFLTADYTLVKTQTKKLINGIKYAMKACEAKNAVIAIKENKTEAIKILQEHLDDNMQVFTVKDVYPAGWEKYIVQHVTKKTYKSLPSEVGVVVNNVATLVALSEAIENNMPLVKKLVTFTGKGLKQPQNVYVKIGAKTNDVIANIGGYEPNLDLQFIAGGLMTGSTIMFDSLVINRSLGSVIVLPKVVKPALLLPCMGCGKCCVNCPVFLSPIEIKRALDAKDNDKLVELKADKCIQCGLCSYVCPSRIELTDATTKARNIVLKGRN